MRERVIDIVEDYLAKRKQNQVIPIKNLRRRIARTGVSEDQLEEILIELEDEWDREVLNQINLKNAKRNLRIGLIATIGLCVFTILFTIDLFQFKMPVVLYGAIAVGFLTASKGYSYIKKSKMIKERREIKWRRYDVIRLS